MRAQLADCLLAVICQRLRFRADLQIRVPECEVLVATHAVKSFIRQGDFFKIASAIEIGADHGMWSFQRYQSWLEKRTNWFVPERDESQEAESVIIPERPASHPGRWALGFRRCLVDGRWLMVDGPNQRPRRSRPPVWGSELPPSAFRLPP